MGTKKMNHLMEDLSCIRFRKLKKNKSDDDPKVLRKALHNSKQSSHFYHDEREPNKNRQSYPGPSRSFSHPHNTTLSTSVKSLPSSPPSHVPFHNRLLGDWCRSKRLEEILPLFPPEMSLFEFSHLSPRMRQVSLGSPGRLVSLSPCDYSNTGNTPVVITLRGGLAHSQVVVRDPRLKEKVVVAINAARAARRQAEEAEQGTPCGSPISLSPNRRSLDVDALGLFHHSRLGSSAGRLSRDLSVISTLSTRSLNTVGRVSQEDLRRNKLVGGMAVSSGNLQYTGTGNVMFMQRDNATNLLSAYCKGIENSNPFFLLFRKQKIKKIFSVFVRQTGR